jgi:putative oxidoreductase
MAVAIALVHARNGFFMNWTGTKPGEGFEFHILAIGIAVAIMIGGAGAASIDGALSRGRT